MISFLANSLFKLVVTKGVYISYAFSFILLSSVVACGINPTATSTSNVGLAATATITTAYTPSPTLSNVTGVYASLTKFASQPTVIVDSWKARWLKGIPCRPPCWEGITPGVTSASDAVDILRKNSLVSNVNRTASEISWNWPDSSTKGVAFYSMQAPNTIIRISPNYSAAFKLKDIIQIYGEPSHVMVLGSNTFNSSTIYYNISIAFVSQGIDFFLITDKPELNANLLSQSILLYSPSIEGYNKAIGVHSKYLVRWEGFKDFSYYCKDAEGSEGACKKQANP